MHIKILKSNGQWIARYREADGGTPHSIIAQFGTCDVPTGFSSSHSVGHVAALVRHAHPGVRVEASA